MDLNAIRIFVKVVQAGSFVQAARQLGIPSSTASAKLATLERHLGVTLLQRTTRKLRLTEAGEAYFRHCQRALSEIAEAEAHLDSSRSSPQGTLKITAPVDLGNTCLAGLVAGFRKKFPEVTLEFLFSGEVLDLVAQGIDVAIRAGDLKDSGLVARRLGLSHWVPFASATYLKKNDPPSHPKDLSQHQAIHFTPFGDAFWELTRGSSTVRVPMRKGVTGNDMNLAKALCLAGQGVSLLPTFACHAEVAAGKLVRLLPEWKAYSDPLHLVYPEQKYVAPKLRAFIDLAVAEFEQILRL